MSDLVHKEVTSGGATSTARHLDSVIAGGDLASENSCCNLHNIGRNLFRCLRLKKSSNFVRQTA
jgi:hypothetical protein